MLTLDDGAGLDVERVVRLGLESARVSGRGGEAVEAGLRDDSGDLAAVVSGESAWQALVVPGDGSSAVAGELEGNGRAGPVDP